MLRAAASDHDLAGPYHEKGVSGAERWAMAAFLEVSGLGKRYGPRSALDEVSFRVEEGELFGLLGPNGAGKTTLLSILSCLLDSDDGEARLKGHRLTPANRAVRQLIGIAPQELAVYGELTARENLSFFGELYGLRGPDLRRRVGEVLTAVGLAERADGRAATFSGGMKRRLNLGAALVHRPPLLLLDEPTAGVDPQSRNHLFEEIRSLNAAGVTILYTSHYMEEVQGLCTHIGIMDQGRLVALGTLPELLRLLDGTIRFEARPLTAVVWAALHDLPDCKVTAPAAPPRPEGGGAAVELRCRDVPATLLRLGADLSSAGAEAGALQVEEPNLERVFLHLTGTALRD
jgi:ABC-2 type transport system ATP-binding protein